MRLSAASPLPCGPLADLCGLQLQDQCAFNGAWGGSRQPKAFYVSSYFWDRAVEAGKLSDHTILQSFNMRVAGTLVISCLTSLPAPGVCACACPVPDSAPAMLSILTDYYGGPVWGAGCRTQHLLSSLCEVCDVCELRD